MRGLRLLTLALLLTGACAAAGFAENTTPAPTMVLSVDDQVRLKLLEEKVEELKKGLGLEAEQLKKGLADVEGKVAQQKFDAAEALLQVESVEKAVEDKSASFDKWNTYLTAGIAISAFTLTAIAIFIAVAGFITVRAKKQEIDDKISSTLAEWDKTKKQHEMSQIEFSDQITLRYNEISNRTEKLFAQIIKAQQQMDELLNQASESVSRTKQEEMKAVNIVRAMTPQGDMAEDYSAEQQKAISEAANQDDDLYAKYAAEAFQALERKDMNAAVLAWGHALKLNPNSYQAHLGMGVCLSYFAAQQSNEQAKKLFLEKAIFEFQAALAINSNYPEAFHNIGNAYRELATIADTDTIEKRHLIHEALAAYQQALRIDPELTVAANNLGATLYSMSHTEPMLNENDRCKILESAREIFQRNISKNHFDADAHFNLASVLQEIADKKASISPHERRELLRRARNHLQTFLAFSPTNTIAHRNLNRTLLITSSPDNTTETDLREILLLDAKYHAQEAIKNDKSMPHYLLACTESRLGNYSAAKECLETDLSTRSIPNNTSCSHLATDPDLQPLREHDPVWWADFMARACPEASQPQGESEAPPA